MKKKWYQSGKDPDYRFSLANERTFLAWIRTALSFLAGGLAVNQFVEGLGVAVFRDIVAILLSISAAMIAIYAYIHWANNEKAMRQNRKLYCAPFLTVLSIVILLLALLLVHLILFVDQK